MDPPQIRALSRGELCGTVSRLNHRVFGSTREHRQTGERMAQVCGYREERRSVKSLVAAAVHSHGASPASRRPLVRLLGIAPAALLLTGLFVTWAGPLAGPAAAAAPSGMVVAWGDNSVRQADVPAGLSGVKAIAASGIHSLALRSDGTVVAWGWDAHGETDVPAGLSGVTAIAAGDRFSLALKSNGTVVAWGEDTYGETDVPAGLSGVTAIAAGGGQSLALKSNGTVVAWGYDQFGDADVPAGLSGVIAIAGGDEFSLALKSNGTVVAWGDDTYGKTDVPSGLSGVSAIAGGGQSLALKSDGTVVGWGDASVPAGLSGVTAIAAGDGFSLALKSDGTIVAWGYDGNGDTDIPAGLSGVTAIAAHGQSSLALAPAAPRLAVWGMTTPRVADSTGTIRVTALDAAGKRIYGYRGTVHFTTSDVDASLPPDYTFVAADNGTHVFTVTLRTAGTQSVTVRDTVARSIVGVQSGIVVTPHVVKTLVVSGMTTPRTAGTTGSIRVTAVDAAGKRVYSYRGTVHFASSDAAASLPLDYTFKAADNGTHVFVGNVILRTAGTQSVSATDTATASIAGTQTGIVVNATPLQVSGMTTPRTAGTASSIQVTAVDAGGNLNPSYLGTIHFTSSDAKAKLPADYTFVAADNGTHAFVGNVILRTAGTQSVTATDTATASIKGAQTGIVVTAAALSKLVVSGLSSPRPFEVLDGGRVFYYPGTIRVTAVDAYGNRDWGYRGKVHFTSSDPAADLPPDYTFKAADNGTHVFIVTLSSDGTQSVTATDTATPSIRGSQTGIVVPYF